jgi:hypothetical protein
MGYGLDSQRIEVRFQKRYEWSLCHCVQVGPDAPPPPSFLSSGYQRHYSQRKVNRVWN